MKEHIMKERMMSRKGLVSLVISAAMGLVALNASAATIFTDDFSDGNMDGWTVSNGTAFVYNGALRFGTEVGAGVTLDLGNIQENTPMTVSFKLRQMNASPQGIYGFVFKLSDSVSGDDYYSHGRLDGWYGVGAQLSGFSGFDANGVFIAGTPGAKLGADVVFHSVEMAFAPGSGMTLKYDGNVVATVADYKSISKMDTLHLSNIGGVVTWYIDDVAVEGTLVPEPASLSLLAIGGVVGLVRRRVK